MKMYDMTANEIAAKNPDTAIVPIGSVEQHGPHLPVSTDCIIAEAYAAAVAERTGAFVTPCIPISTCYEHKGKKGCVSMRPQTCAAMLEDVVLNLAEQGFKKIVIFQGHGGIFVVPPVVRKLNADNNPAFFVARVEIMNLMAAATERGILTSGCMMHADEYETSLVLHLRPELVDMSKAVDCVPEEPREFLNYGSIYNFSPSGVWGCPSAASEEKGKKLFEAGIEDSLAYIEKVFSVMQRKKFRF